MRTEAKIDPAIASRLFIIRRADDDSLEIWMVPDTNGKMVLPGLYRYIGESTTKTVDRIGRDVLGLERIGSYDRAGRVLNEHDHPDFPIIAKVFILFERALHGVPTVGRWVGIDELEGVLAPSQWAMVWSCLDYLTKHRNDRREFLHTYKGVATPEEYFTWKTRIDGEAAAGYGLDYIWEINTHSELEWANPAEYFRSWMTNTLSKRIFV